MQLFGITARLDGVTERERVVVENFLSQQLNPQDVPKYLDIFETHAHLKTSEVYEQGMKLTPVRVSSKMLRIGTQINQELTQPQKMVVIARILELITADDTVSRQEQDFVSTLATVFNISQEEFGDIERFVRFKGQGPIQSEKILVINNQEQQIHQQQLYKPYFLGNIIILHISSLEMYLAKYLGQQDYYLNGVIMKPLQLYSFPTGSAIRGARVEPIYYSDIAVYFRRDTSTEPISFEVKDLSYLFPNKKSGLQQINIAEKSGTLVGIMGASGSGKSTLLEVLNGNLKPRQGQVLINGSDVHGQKLEGIIGYVSQSDMLIEELTVYENLYYAAKLSFGNYSEREIAQLVAQTLSNLGLSEIQHLKVGSQLNRIISGGQRKRLNIGLELLRSPSILFVDEPTSGLSSRDSENIMDLLKELTLRGNLVFVVIHQPSVNIYKMLDKLYILDTGGFPIYYGNPLEALTYFKKAANQVNSEQVECSECGNVNVEEIFDIIETRVVNEFGRFTEKRKMTAEQWHERFQQDILLPQVETVEAPLQSKLRLPSRWQQARLFLQRDWLKKVSDRQYLWVSGLQAPLLSFLLAFVHRYYPSGQEGYIFAKNENIPAFVFISIIVILFIGLIMSAEEIYQDRKVLKREAFLNLSRGSYLSAKISLLFFISLLQSFLMVLTGYWLLGLQDLWLGHWLVLFSCACFANVLGLNISSAFRSAVTIYVLIPILLIPQMVLGGIVIQFDKVNPQLHLNQSSHIPWVGELMASRWAFEAAMVAQFRDNNYDKHFFAYDRTRAIAEYKKVYYLPSLEKLLQEAAQSPQKLALLHQELPKEWRYISSDYQDDLQVLYKEGFEAYAKGVRLGLEFLQKYYLAEQRKAEQQKNQKAAAFSENQLFEWRKKYHNEAVYHLLVNRNTEERIVIEGTLVTTRLYPIYRVSESPIAHFFAPEKSLSNTTFDTFWFNIAVIWLMIFFLAILLYFDALARGLRYLTRLRYKPEA